MKITCENCLNNLKCLEKDRTSCDDWEGDCEICFMNGQPVFKKYCGDCDWEDEEEED